MEYWTIGYGVQQRFGHNCRECHMPIEKGDKVVYRDGRRIRLFYHNECFSGTADPRTQSGSSYNEGRMPKSCFSSKAPPTKYKIR
ncbi:hypothetical protein SteCoe_18207 [Stentor coeruleus]|uniref:PARP-type domain-containing protein n=1 Tax=Stentor coeruleus TaxID=5963 RepID=A0A1R2BX22_9CILI|nr:hypothetical protein SteCoe_18207 [Stentor coeruleus]